MIDDIIKLSRRFLEIKNEKYKRFLIKSTNFKNNRLSLILGQRGVGKTTTLIQWLLSEVKSNILSEKILYVPADHFQIGNKTLYEIADEFTKLGGKFIAFDEIHKYQNWSKELKSIYDTYNQITFLCLITNESSLTISSNLSLIRFSLIADISFLV